MFKVGFRVMSTVSENEAVRFSGLSLKKTMIPRMRHAETMSRAAFNTNKIRLGNRTVLELQGTHSVRQPQVQPVILIYDVLA